nr:hypothetical protein [uncultured Bacillus sp.]
MERLRLLFFTAVVCLIALTGCTIKDESAVINRNADVLLTNKNELQFRFKINEEIFTTEKMYKVKVQIHSDRLAAALGNSEIIYGGKEVFNGESLEVENNRESFIYMDPVPLLRDLHVFDIKEMITDQRAVSVEILSNEEVIAKAYLTNFTSQM